MLSPNLGKRKTLYRDFPAERLYDLEIQIIFH
jgi:hypothetical protein